MKLWSNPVSSTISFRNGDDSEGNISLPAVTICLESYKIFQEGNFNNFRERCQTYANFFFDTMYQCYDSRNESLDDETTTTTESGLIPNWFDTTVSPDRAKVIPFNNVPELVHDLNLNVSDIIKSYSVGSVLGASRQIYSFDEFHEVLESDWIKTVNFVLGACFTLDLRILNQTFVPMLTYRHPHYEFISINLELQVSSNILLS